MLLRNALANEMDGRVITRIRLDRVSSEWRGTFLGVASRHNSGEVRALEVVANHTCEIIQLTRVKCTYAKRT